MPHHIKLAALLALVVAHDIKTQIEAKKAAKLYLNAHKTFEEAEAIRTAQISYLCHLIDNSDIEVDEFDLIALSYHS